MNPLALNTHFKPVYQAANSNPPVWRLADHVLRNNTCVRLNNADSIWIHNNYLAIGKTLKRNRVDLTTLTENVGINRSFALLIHCYQIAYAKSEKGDKRAQQTLKTFGNLIEALACNYPQEYRQLNLEDLNFYSNGIDKAFLNRLIGSPVKSYEGNYTIVNLALGALALSALAYTLWSRVPNLKDWDFNPLLGDRYRNSAAQHVDDKVVKEIFSDLPKGCTTSEEMDAVQRGLAQSCANIGKEIFGEKLVSTKFIFHDNLNCYIYVDKGAADKYYKMMGALPGGGYSEGVNDVSNPLIPAYDVASIVDDNRKVWLNAVTTYAKTDRIPKIWQYLEDRSFKNEDCIGSSHVHNHFARPDPVHDKLILQSKDKQANCFKEGCLWLKTYIKEKPR